MQDDVINDDRNGDRELRGPGRSDPVMESLVSDQDPSYFWVL